MHWGGVETWLMQVLRQIDRERFGMDFLVESVEPSPHGAEIRALGSRILGAPGAQGPLRPWWYARHLGRFLRERGPYDVVHSHVHHANGYVLRLARRAGVPARIAHSHLETAPLQAGSGPVRRGYLALMNRWIAGQATLGLAASRKAAADLFGPAWHDDARWRIHHCGLDLAPFRQQVDPLAVRAELGFPADALVVGHVGRFTAQKNHSFLLEIVGEAARREPRLRLLLVGDGPLRPAVERQAAQLGLAERVVFAGPRHDVPRLMLGAMDLLLFPSLFEGLGLVLVEAQAAGLPCLLSGVIPEEADVVKPLVHRLSLAGAAAGWVETILAIGEARAPLTRPQALRLVEQSPFNIRTEVRELERLYLNSILVEADRCSPCRRC